MELKAYVDTPMTIIFKNSLKKVPLDLQALANSTIEFLELYQGSHFARPEFWELIAAKNGQEQFTKLLSVTGYENDTEGFFADIFNQVAKGEGRAIVIHGVILPHALLVALLELVLPGNGYISIKNTQQLEEVTNVYIPDDRRDDIQKVIDVYPVRLSRHTIRQMMVSKNVAYQYMPFIQELNSSGFDNTWIGQFHEGLFEQMYQNRVIFLLNMGCPVYCRFCFRKHKDSRNEANPSVDDVKKAVNRVKSSPAIKEIIVTGGDPFMNRKNMEATIDGLMQVDHVETLRLATRSIAYYPDMFLKNEEEYLKYLLFKGMQLQQYGKRMEIATHFIHPDEISPESLEIISELVKNGIAVYIQTPFLNNCNDAGPELVELFSRLRGAGAEIHYIYIPCSPIKGNSIYWKPLSYGINMGDFLRANLSDRAIPRICTATPIGKMDWFSSGWAVERVENNNNFVWIRTPYTPDFFKSFAPLADDLDNIRINAEGTIDIQYLAEVGDDSYLIGPRPKRKSEKHPPARVKYVEQLQQELAQNRQTAHTIVNTGLDHLCRSHKTRVEIDFAAGDEELNYITHETAITDVVISSEEDAIDVLAYIRDIINKLEAIPHINAVRLRSMKLNHSPELFTRSALNALGDMNKLRIINPLRLEIETWFISHDEITPEHQKLVTRLNNKGITVYCNVPLLGGVNDSDHAIQQLAHQLRKTGIEFHHLYIAGLPIQKNWNSYYPIDTYDVTDIATLVRREGSGREIPRYIIYTPFGEIDYALTSSFREMADGAKIRLDCYDKTYYRSMNQYFAFDHGLEFDDERPVVEIPGLLKTNNFKVS
ncbi:MAG: radical SAM protein [Thermodesulfobacteriota bacterium]|nr:radical SAM protein [Thermodesulfobacteriota bacterium]